MFMLMFCVCVDVCVGAGGCSSRTRLAWFSEHSQGVCGFKELRVVFVGQWPYAFIVLFVVHLGALGSASAVFIGFAVLSDDDEV